VADHVPAGAHPLRRQPVGGGGHAVPRHRRQPTRTDELATYAANLYLDSLNAIARLDERRATACATSRPRDRGLPRRRGPSSATTCFARASRSSTAACSEARRGADRGAPVRRGGRPVRADLLRPPRRVLDDRQPRPVARRSTTRRRATRPMDASGRRSRCGRG